jgi:minor extracellular serine protease Vpr
LLGYTTSSGDIFNITSAEIIPASKEFLAENDACNPLQLDAKGKALLVNRGGCMFSQKVINAQNAGAIAVLIYNNSPGPVTPSIPEGMVDIDYGGISKDDGYKLFYYLASHPDDNEAEFLKEDVSLPVPTAGFISSFSSWGLGPDLSLKPDISAPGGEIYST